MKKITSDAPFNLFEENAALKEYCSFYKEDFLQYKAEKVHRGQYVFGKSNYYSFLKRTNFREKVRYIYPHWWMNAYGYKNVVIQNPNVVIHDNVVIL